MVMQPSSLNPTSMPPKLSWVTVPLIINIVLGILGLLALPFLGALMAAVFSTPTSGSVEDIQALQFAKVFTGSTLWIIAILTLLILWLHWYTYKSLQQGEAVGRTIAIILAILSLFNFPIGTVLGILMLIGAFDTEVTQYASR